MNAIEKALDEIKFAIPREILERTFTDQRFLQRRIPVSLETRIKEEVIDKRVLVDCNLYGAMQVEVPLASIPPQQVDGFSSIFNIPKNLTQGRSISSVLSVGLAYHQSSNHGFSYHHKQSTLSNGINQVLDSNLDSSPAINCYVQLIGENTVYLEHNGAPSPSLTLRCMVDHDSQMSSIQPASYIKFSNLAVLAAKAHVWRVNQFAIGQTALHAGMELGVYRDVVDGYSDANELYAEYLNDVWRKVSLLNDPRSYQRHLRSLVGGGR